MRVDAHVLAVVCRQQKQQQEHLSMAVALRWPYYEYVLQLEINVSGHNVALIYPAKLKNMDKIDGAYVYF